MAHYNPVFPFAMWPRPGHLSQGALALTRRPARLFICNLQEMAQAERVNASKDLHAVSPHSHHSRAWVAAHAVYARRTRGRLRVPARTVRELIRKGLSHQREVREHILIDLQLSPDDRHRQALQIGGKLFERQQARAVCFGRSDDRGGKATPAAATNARVCAVKPRGIGFTSSTVFRGHRYWQ